MFFILLANLMSFIAQAWTDKDIDLKNVRDRAAHKVGNISGAVNTPYRE